MTRKCLRCGREKRIKCRGSVIYGCGLTVGNCSVGDDIMQVLIGGDIRPHVVDALQALVEQIKSTCVTETELF